MAAGAATLLSAAISRPAFAQQAKKLRAETRVLDVNGRAATVFGLNAGKGLMLDPGERFQVELTNALDVETLIHWHGQIPPNDQDGVPGLPMPMLRPGENRSYDFAPVEGTHWMHAHIPRQEMNLLAAPLIVRSKADMAADRQEVTMFLHDLSFKSPDEVLAEITGGAGGHGGHGVSAPAPSAGGAISHAMPGMDMGSMQMDLNDYEWDAYLANDRTLADPDVVGVEAGGRVRLRIINGASATVFWIDLGALEGRLVAVDGHGIVPVSGRRFGIAMGQRLDIECDVPYSGAFPVLALREGAIERTGIILATPGAAVEKLDDAGGEKAAAFDLDLAQEASLVGLQPLPERAVDRTHTVVLGGSMQPYVWTIDDRVWGDHKPLAARSGERVEIMFHNGSMMGHPMHLHGHAFQVVDINGRRMQGARRDTVYVPPMSMVTIALDAGEAARWMLHCHHMPHLETGMMTEFAIL